MKVIAINGSPRMEKGYTALILTPFIHGMMDAGMALANIRTVELLLAIKRRVLTFVFNATNFLARKLTLILTLNIDGFR